VRNRHILSIIPALTLYALLDASSAWSQQMYRCTAPNGAVSFQDKPCGSGTKQSAVAVPQMQRAAPSEVRVRPFAGSRSNEEQKKDFDKLLREYAETFRVIGRAQGCGLDWKTPYDELFAQLQRRHSQEPRDNIINIVAGNAMFAGKTGGQSSWGAKPGEPLSCGTAADRLAGLRLPDAPASLIVRDNLPAGVRATTSSPFSENAREELSLNPWEEVGKRESPVSRDNGDFTVTAVSRGEGPAVKAGDLVKIRIHVTTPPLYSNPPRRPAPQVSWLWTGREPGLDLDWQESQSWGSLGSGRVRKTLVGRAKGERFRIGLGKNAEGGINSIPLQGIIEPIQGSQVAVLPELNLSPTGYAPASAEIEILAICEGRLLRRTATLRQWGMIIPIGQSYAYAREGTLRWSALEGVCGPSDGNVRFQGGPYYFVPTGQRPPTHLYNWKDSYLRIQEADRKEQLGPPTLLERIFRLWEPPPKTLEPAEIPRTSKLFWWMHKEERLHGKWWAIGAAVTKESDCFEGPVSGGYPAGSVHFIDGCREWVLNRR
jgi:hypothetical protein